MSETDLFITTIEGPNHIGKGALADRVMYILSVLAQWQARNSHESFSVARVVEPPDIPIIFPTNIGQSVEVKDNGTPTFLNIRQALGYEYFVQLDNMGVESDAVTWRQILKGDVDRKFLKRHSSRQTREAQFAEGFLTSRAIVEGYMKYFFHWDPTKKMPKYVDMVELRNANYDLKSNSRILVKDRGTGSTDVFQGDDIEVRELIRTTYEAGELLKEDITFVLVPHNEEVWLAQGNTRDSDRDVHDVQRQNQLQKYLQLRSRMGMYYSKDIVYIENDTTGNDFHINQVPFIIALVLFLKKTQGSLNWFDEGQGINSIDLNLLELINLFGSYGSDGYGVPGFMTDNCFVAFYERIHPKYFYKGIPLLYYSGDIGIIYQDMRFQRRGHLNNTEIIVAKDMRENVIYNEKYY